MMYALCASGIANTQFCVWQLLCAVYKVDDVR